MPLIYDTVHFAVPNDTDIFYGLFRSKQAEVRNITHSTWDVWPGPSSSLADYAIEEGAGVGGIWVGAIPALGQGTYLYEIRKRAGAVPNTDDEQVGLLKGYQYGGDLIQRVYIDNPVVLDTDGLDYVGYSAVPGYPSDFGKRLNWLIDRFLNESILDNNTNTLKVKNSVGTVLTTQTLSDVGGIETVGEAT